MASRSNNKTPDAFAIKDCTVMALAAGIFARDAGELRDGLARAPADSVYYHFWGARLRPTFDDPEFVNDFASWAGRHLHDRALAERLAVVDPTDLDDLESLRQEVVDIIEESLDYSERLQYLRADQDFAFIRSQLIIFDTRRRVKEPAGLAKAVKTMSLGSVFYHFIDARRRLPEKIDDFSAWLSGFGDEARSHLPAIASIDPYFTSLSDLRARLVEIFQSMLPSATQKGRGKSREMTS